MKKLKNFLGMLIIICIAVMHIPNSVSAAVSAHTVTFDTDGGTTVESQSITYGRYATEPTNPTKNGFVFQGWFKDVDKTEPYSFTEEITGDITLYAKWTDKYTYDFLFNTGEQSFTAGAIDEYIIIIDAPFNEFSNLKVNGVEYIENTNYEVTDENTTITFKEDGLKKLNDLSTNEYEVEIEIGNHRPIAKLNLNEKNPQTFDRGFIDFLVLAIISVSGLISAIVVYRKKLIKNY